MPRLPVKRWLRAEVRAWSRLAVALLLTAPAFASIPGCSATGKWQAPGVPSRLDAGRLLESQGPSAMLRDSRPEGAPAVPMRERLRPCCAFGMGLALDVGFMPLLGYRIDNVIGPDELGPHRYDSGVIILERDRGEGYSPSEANGLVYTCRGGFIDTAHVRDYVDWAMYLSALFGARFGEGGSFDLPDEGGRRRFVLQPLPPELIREYGLRELFSAFSQWAAWQLSLWHEIATWYGWSALSAFPESASAFSPEDLYSNAIGIKLIDGVIADKTGRTETLYNQSVNVWLQEVLKHLGAVDEELGEGVMQALDGHWWDSRERLPSPTLVTRRNLDLGPSLAPWRAPEQLLGPELSASLARACAGHETVQPLPVHDRLGSLVFADWLRFEIALDEALAEHPAFTDLGPVVDQSAFPAIVARIREEVRERFGDGADRPD